MSEETGERGSDNEKTEGYQVATKHNPTLAGSILTPPKPKKRSQQSLKAARRTIGR
jgi:hypothetical protein